MGNALDQGQANAQARFSIRCAGCIEVTAIVADRQRHLACAIAGHTHLDISAGRVVAQGVVHQVAQGQLQQGGLPGQRQGVLRCFERDVLAQLVGQRRMLRHHAQRQGAQVHRFRRVSGQALGPRQVQQLRQDAPRPQCALLHRLQGLGLFVGSAVAGQPGLQHQRGQGGAQLVGHVGGKAPLACDLGLQAKHQSVDGLHRHAQFPIRLLRHQGLACIDIERRDLARQTLQRQQAAANGRGQHQRHQWQEHQRGQQDVLRNVGGQRIPARWVQKNRHAAQRGCACRFGGPGRLGHIHTPILRNALHRQAQCLVAQWQARWPLIVHAVRIPKQSLVLPDEHMEFRHVSVGRMLAQGRRQRRWMGRWWLWRTGRRQGRLERLARRLIQRLAQQQLRSRHQQTVADFFGLVVASGIGQCGQQNPQRHHRTQGPGPQITPQRAGLGLARIELRIRALRHQDPCGGCGAGTK